MSIPVIKWDTSLPLQAEKTEVQRWDEWFALVKDEETNRGWEVVKQLLPQEAWVGWAMILESNRLSRIGC